MAESLDTRFEIAAKLGQGAMGVVYSAFELYELISDSGGWFLAMELVEGHTFADYVRAPGYQARTSSLSSGSSAESDRPLSSETGSSSSSLTPGSVERTMTEDVSGAIPRPDPSALKSAASTPTQLGQDRPKLADIADIAHLSRGRRHESAAPDDGARVYPSGRDRGHPLLQRRPGRRAPLRGAGGDAGSRYRRSSQRVYRRFCG